MVLQKTVESSQEGKEIQPVHPKGNQPWIFLGRTDAEAEAPILFHQMWRSDSLGKKPWYWVRLRQKEKRVQRMRCLDNIMDVNEHEFKQTPGDSEGQRSLICCSPWDCKKLDLIYQLNNNNIEKCFICLSEYQFLRMPTTSNLAFVYCPLCLQSHCFILLSTLDLVHLLLSQDSEYCSESKAL